MNEKLWQLFLWNSSKIATYRPHCLWVMDSHVLNIQSLNPSFGQCDLDVELWKFFLFEDTMYSDLYTVCKSLINSQVLSRQNDTMEFKNSLYNRACHEHFSPKNNVTWELQSSKGSLLVLIYRSHSHPYVSRTFQNPLSGEDLQRTVTISFEVLPYVCTTLCYSDG